MELLKKETDNSDVEKLAKLNASLVKIRNKESKMLFCITESQNPVASIYEIYFQATTLKKAGYDVTIITEKDDYLIPNWIERELTDFTHVSMNKINMPIGPEDVLIVPEVFTNVMEQTKDLPCIRITLLQSIDYLVNSLLVGMDLFNFEVQNILTTSNTLKNLYEEFYGKNRYNIKKYNIGIPDYFTKQEKPQKPIVSIIGRNNNEITKIVKLFYAKYPQYSWINFDTMITQSKPPMPLNRIDFAERLKGNFAAVWVDRISSFGTFPLECMKSGVIPIAVKPDLTPEYLIETDENGDIKYKNNSGVWTTDIYAIPILLGDIITKFLDDSIGTAVYEKMDEIVSEYTPEISASQILVAYESFLNERAEIFEKIITDSTKK